MKRSSLSQGLALVLTCIVWPSIAHAQFATTRIVRTGDTLGDGSVVVGPYGVNASGSVFSLFSLALNNSGEVAVALKLTNTTGGAADDERLYKTQSGVLTEIAREGQVYEGHAFAGSDFGFIGGYVLAEDGSVTFAPVLNAANGPSLVRAQGGSLNTIVRAGDASPDANGTMTLYRSARDSAVQNRAGTIFARVTLAGGSTTTETDEGCLLREGGVTSLPVREGVTSTAPGFKVFSLLPSLLLNQTDNIGGFALTVFATKTAPTVIESHTLKITSAGVQLINRTPYPSASPVPLYSFGVTSSNQVCSLCTLNGGTTDTALALVGSGAPTLRLKSTTAAVGGGSYASFLATGVNQAGAMLVFASLTGAPDGAENTLLSINAAGAVAPVIRDLAPVPDVANRRFGGAVPFGFNSSGNALALVVFKDGSGTGTTDTGLYLYQGGVLREVARTGSVIDGKTVGFVYPGNACLNDRNQIAAVVLFDDNTAGVYRFDFGGTTPPGQPDIVIEQPAGSALVNGTASVDFGDATVGVGKALTFTVKNAGTANLTLQPIAKDGVNASDFTITGPAATTLAPNARTTFTVSLKAGAMGSRDAVLRVRSNDADEFPFNIALTGNGVVKPVITTSPSSQLVLTSDTNVTLTVAASGGGVQTIKWLKNGVVIPGATSTTLTLPTVTLNDADLYSATVSNFAGSATSTAARLGVIDADVMPIGVADAGTLKLLAPVKLPTGAVATYQWKRNSTDVSNGGTAPAQVISGARMATLNITKMVSGNTGAYTCLIGMDALPAKECGARNVSIVPAPVVNAAGPFAWIVSGTVTDRISATNIPTKFTITGLPAGVTYNSVTGQLSGKPNAPTSTTKTFTVTATNAAGDSSSVAMTYSVAALQPAVTGTFNGLIDRSSTLSGPIASTVLKDHGGVLSNLVVSSTGSFTGTLKLDDKDYAMPAASRLNAHLAGNPDATVMIVRGTQTDAIPDLILSFQINLGTGELTGTISDGSASANVRAVRKTAATAANYTAALLLDPARVGTDPTTTPPGNAANAAYPQGTGHTTLAITAAGSATWGGKLADGTAVTFATTLGPNGEVPLHLLLYTPTVAATAGSLHGWTKITGTDLDSVAPFDWLKLPQLSTSTTRSYKNGFPKHNLTLTGGKYVAPTNATSMLGLAAPPSNAKLDFTEGGIKDSTLGSSGALAQVFSISATNAITMPPGLANNPGTVTLASFSATTGAISGNFTLTDNDPRDVTPPIATVTRSTPWSGVLVPRLGIGVGQFQLAKLPTNTPPATTPATSPQLSGKVVLKASP